jgi:hypothetical protein
MADENFMDKEMHIFRTTYSNEFVFRKCHVKWHANVRKYYISSEIA